MKRLGLKFNKFTHSHPIEVITIAILISLGLFGKVTWNVWSMYRNFQAVIINEFELQKLSSSIVHLDEVLTMSARMAATTGNLEWEDRYRKFEPELDAIIKKTIQLAPTAYEAGAIQTDDANIKLVEMEDRAFELIRQGRQEEALSLLLSPEYDRQKTLYTTGINTTISAIQTQITSELNSFQERLFFSGTFATSSLMILAIAWGAVIKLIKQYIQERKTAEKALKIAKDKLELRVEERTAQLARSNREVALLNERLKAENLRLSAEVDVTRKLQQMILPKAEELCQIPGLDIAGFMEPASEVGGDYYDVLQRNGRVKIGIGDVTGHGLESGVLMLMVQTAVRTLLENNETNHKKFLSALNRTIYDNVQRMNSDKNLTLMLLDYYQGILTASGQHEQMILVRSGTLLDAEAAVEIIDTIDLGFPIGLEENIVHFIAQTKVYLQPGDVVVLYTDGITEAENERGDFYGLERLCETVKQNYYRSATEILQAAIADWRGYIGDRRVDDDITLLVFKRIGGADGNSINND